MRHRILFLASAAALLAAGPASALDLKTSLTGDGTGQATVKLDPAKGQVCYKLTVSGLSSPATMAHVHKAPAGENGPVVVPMNNPADGASEGCATVAKDVIEAIAAAPAGYYVNVHTKAAPGGALRGQLAP